MRPDIFGMAQQKWENDMKWRGQGTLVVGVLAAAAAFGYQWTSMEKLQDHAIGYGISYGPYARLVSEFVEREKRWPQPEEIDFSSVAEGGVIRAAELQQNGEILFTFSAWTITSGYVHMVFAPTLNTHATTHSGGRLSYACVEVSPARYESIVCRSEGTTRRAAIAAENVGAFAKWQNAQQQQEKEQSDFEAAVTSAANTPTQCDALWSAAHADVIPCVEAVNPDLARELSARSEKIFTGPRLRPEIIARNPDMLDAFNRKCEESWRMLVGQAIAKDGNARGCF